MCLLSEECDVQWKWEPPQSDTQGALSPMSVQYSWGVSARTALKYPDPWRTQGESHPLLGRCHWGKFKCLSDFRSIDVTTQAQLLCFRVGIHVAAIEEFLQVFLPPPNYILRRGQYLHFSLQSNQTEFLQGWLKVYLYGFNELLPHLNFSLGDLESRATLGKPEAVSCFKSPTS